VQAGKRKVTKANYAVPIAIGMAAREKSNSKKSCLAHTLGRARFFEMPRPSFILKPGYIFHEGKPLHEINKHNFFINWVKTRDGNSAKLFRLEQCNL
jgi:hypothetical protein